MFAGFSRRMVQNHLTTILAGDKAGRVDQPFGICARPRLSKAGSSRFSCLANPRRTKKIIPSSWKAPRAPINFWGNSRSVKRAPRAAITPSAVPYACQTGGALEFAVADPGPKDAAMTAKVSVRKEARKGRRIDARTRHSPAILQGGRESVLNRSNYMQQKAEERRRMPGRRCLRKPVAPQLKVDFFSAKGTRETVRSALQRVFAQTYRVCATDWGRREPMDAAEGTAQASDWCVWAAQSLDQPTDESGFRRGGRGVSLSVSSFLATVCRGARFARRGWVRAWLRDFDADRRADRSVNFG